MGHAWRGVSPDAERAHWTAGQDALAQLPAEEVRRARLILLLAQGKSYLAIRQVLGCNPNYISRWKGRFEADRLAALYSHYRGRAVEKRTPALEAKILQWTRRPAPDGSTHWSSRKLAAALGH
jgi:transposase